MAKSLSSILSQIERLQKEADAIQSEVIDRIRKEITKYSLTAEQLFGKHKAHRTRVAKPGKRSTKARTVKFADGLGNTWGGMGKRPEWLREALNTGKALEEFLVGGDTPKAIAAARTSKPAAKAKRKVAARGRVAAKKSTAVKKAARKPRTASAVPASE